VPVHYRRVVALLTGVMMLALVLTESGFACAMPSMAASSEAAAAGSAMSDMGGMRSMAGGRESADAPQSSHRDEAPCRFPWAPTGCQDAAPCGPAALVVAAWRPEVYGPERDVQRTATVLAPPSFDTPPEPPPPRA
jgi:hypothetical protein